MRRCQLYTWLIADVQVALSYLLQGATKANVSSRLRAYQRLRQPRTDAMLRSSIAMGKVSSSSEADAEVSAHDRKMMSDRDWIWNYDVLREVKEVFQYL